MRKLSVAKNSGKFQLPVVPDEILTTGHSVSNTDKVFDNIFQSFFFFLNLFMGFVRIIIGSASYIVREELSVRERE